MIRIQIRYEEKVFYKKDGETLGGQIAQRGGSCPTPGIS